MDKFGKLIMFKRASGRSLQGHLSEQRIIWLLEGVLTDGERYDVLQHLWHCRECGRTVSLHCLTELALD